MAKTASIPWIRLRRRRTERQPRPARDLCGEYRVAALVAESSGGGGGCSLTFASVSAVTGGRGG